MRLKFRPVFEYGVGWPNIFDAIAGGLFVAGAIIFSLKPNYRQCENRHPMKARIADLRLRVKRRRRALYPGGLRS
jgi:hypothetical protein